MTKTKKHRAKKPTKCSCLKGWVCEDHPNQPWGHRGCQAAGELCTNPQCNKDPDSIFLSIDCQFQPGRRNRQLEKLCYQVDLIHPSHFGATRQTTSAVLTTLRATGAEMKSVCGQPMNLHRFWDGVITSSQNFTRLRNEATALRSRQEFQRGQLTELASSGFEMWAKESFEIATKIAYRNGGRIGMPRGGNKDCTLVTAAPVLPVGYVVSASRIADRRIVLAGYRLADLLTRALKL